MNYSSSFQICRSRWKYRHTPIPANARIKNRNAAPEPFPQPKSFTRRLPLLCAAMTGSNTWSTRNPPRKYPMGMVKNCRELRTEYTRPCISKGTCSRRIASRFVLIRGMKIQPKNPPRHQTSGVRPNASRKFSVLMENSRQPQITRTRLFGAFRNAARRLPENVVMPITVLTSPSTFSLPPFLESIMAGNAAS